ncbi:MAG: PBSX family phage terminase large subunit [Clostridia bacterium]|nr:PBSX family phage terminase large subunit [Clostridia bacterium]
MANEENLIPVSERTKSEQREIQSKGGKKSGEARRRKRSMKQAMELLLSMPATTQADWELLGELGISLNDFSEEEINNLLVVNAALLRGAKAGDVASIRELRSVIQDDALMKHRIRMDKAHLALEQKKNEPDVRELPQYRGIPSSMIAPTFAPVLFDLADRLHTEYVFPGGRGSTKSSFVSLALIDRLMQSETIHAVVLRQVGNTLRSTVYTQVQWAIEALGLDAEFKCTVSPLEITRITTGQKIYFRGADDPGKLKSIKVPFGHIGALWFEELDQFGGEEAVRKIEQSVIRGGDEAYIFKSFNPPKSANNWANKYIRIPKETRLVTESNYLSVPQKWLGKPFLDEAEFLRQINPTAYENEYLGVANGTGGNVFDNVQIRRITDDEIGNMDRLYRGVDWGWFPDPYQYVCCYYDKARLTLYIIDEYRANKQSNAETAQALKNRGVTPNDLLICDSAEPKSVRDYKNEGLMAIEAKKPPGSVDYGMKWLQSLRAIVIDNVRCPHTAEEFINYEYERDKEGNVISGYPDRDNHSIDAVRYAMNREALAGRVSVLT